MPKGKPNPVAAENQSPVMYEEGMGLSTQVRLTTESNVPQVEEASEGVERQVASWALGVVVTP